MLRRLFIGLLLLLAVVAAGAIATAPADLRYVPVAQHIDGDASAWIAARESGASATIPGTEKRIRWYDNRAASITPYSIVYLHGFSATRQELAPVGELLADSLGANLFETRLAGHGLLENPLADVRAEDWLDDAVEALSVGAAIGERIILMGTSTGGTLALVVADHAAFDKVDSLVLISPNFAPRDSSAEILTWPGGPQLATLLVGETRSWTAANDLQERYWSTTYPMAATVEMMRLVDLARDKLPMQIRQSLLTLYSPNDQVVDIEWIRSALEQIDSPRTETVEIELSGDPSNHVLAGDILAPENNQLVAEHIVRFLRASDL